jgi:cyclophilin family peptidyl-prolyl cis-trans isomerase
LYGKKRKHQPQEYQLNQKERREMTEEKNPQVVMETSMGTVKIELFKDKAPISTRNFLSYVKDAYYDGTIFHRVIKTFMVQGGGMDVDMQPKKTKFAIKNEATNGLKNTRGTLAMARTSVVDSATSQFFINVVDNAFLDHTGKTPDRFGYAVFAQVVEGMDVVDAIREVKTGNKNGHGDVPVEPVFINSIRLIEE